MYEELFPSHEVQQWLQSTSATALIESYGESLRRAGFKDSTMRQRIHTAAHMGHWLDQHEIQMDDVDDETIERFIEHLATCRCARIRPGKHMHTKAGARRFLRHLRHEGIVPERQEVRDEGDALLERFSDWLRRHRGATDSTVQGYRPFVRVFMEALGTDPRQYDVTSIRGFVLTHYHGAQTSYAKAVASKIRMFLRFLVFEGRCPSSLIDAVPKTAKWTLTDVPRYLPADEIEKIVEAPNERSRAALRDRAVILLLARLGLRAGDIVELRLSDIAWRRGKIRVMGKGRRESWLPLPQDAGDAVLEYIQKARPRSSDEHLFLRSRAPVGPISTSSVGYIVRSALDRAGVERPAGVSAHLFRHSLARKLLSQDIPLEGIAVVLRHRSLETTAKYAKIDLETLKSVVQEWPEEMSC